MDENSDGSMDSDQIGGVFAKTNKDQLSQTLEKMKELFNISSGSSSENKSVISEEREASAGLDSSKASSTLQDSVRSKTVHMSKFG